MCPRSMTAAYSRRSEYFSWGTRDVVKAFHYVPSPNPQIDSANRWGNYDETYDETYDEIMMKLWWNYDEIVVKTASNI